MFVEGERVEEHDWNQLIFIILYSLEHMCKNILEWDDGDDMMKTLILLLLILITAIFMENACFCMENIVIFINFVYNIEMRDKSLELLLYFNEN